MTDNLDNALALAKHGLPVFPCHPETKAPLIRSGFHAASLSPLDIKKWWGKHPQALIGVPTGVPSGLLVVDFDGTPEAEAWLLTHATDGARIHHTRREGGRHVVYKMPDDEDIRSGTNVLGKGIDVRANGGYIIYWPAHGCEVEGAKIVDLVDPPTHVRKHLSTVRKAEEIVAPQPEAATLPAAEIQALLQAFDPNCGYDEWYRLGMAVHSACGGATWGLALWDEWSKGGAKYKGPADLKPHWRSFKVDGGVSAGLLLARAVAPVDAFDVVPDEVLDRPKLQCVDALEEVKPIVWILEDFIPRCEVFALYGLPKSGKSYALLDMALAISRGIEWQGRATKGGVVVWVTAEGNHSTRRRIEAYKRRERCMLPGFYIYNDAPQLSRQDDVKALANAVMPLAPSLILIDALIGVTRGIDENDRKMGEVLQKAATYLNQQTGATVGVIHHSGKDQSKGMRGSTAILGVVEAALRIRVEGDYRTLILEDGRDVEGGAAFHFSMEPDKHGGVVLQEASAPVRLHSTPRSAGAKLVYTMLQHTEFVPLAEARDSFYGTLDDTMTPDAKRMKWNRVVAEMKRSAWCRVNDDMIERPDYI